MVIGVKTSRRTSARQVGGGERRPGLVTRALSRVFDAWWEAKDPQRAIERRVARENANRLAHIAASNMDRFMRALPDGGDANAVTLDELPKIRDRARDAALNDPIAKAIRRTMANHVVGRGIRPQCQIDHKRLKISEQQAQDWQGECEAHFERMVPHADVTTRLPFYGLQRLIYESAWDGGDVFPSFPMVLRDDGAPAMTRINLIEAERVDTPPGKALDPNVMGGVQMDKWGRPVGFHVYRGHPGDKRLVRNPLDFEFWAARRAGRVNVLQAYHQERIGQARGIPGLTPALPLLDHVSGYVDDTILAARLQTAISVWIETSGDPAAVRNALADKDRTAQYQEWAEKGIQSGSINVLRSGDSAKFMGPTTPAAYFDPFVVRLLRIIAGCIGVPYEILAADVASANYSSMKSAFQSFKITLAREQDLIIPTLDAYWFHVIYEGWLDAKMGEVGLRVPFEDAPAEWARVIWRRPSPGHVDPTREMQAYALAVESGFMAQRDVIEEGGGNYDDTLRKLQREAEDKKTWKQAAPAPGDETEDEDKKPNAAEDDTSDDADDGDGDGEQEDAEAEVEQEANA